MKHILISFCLLLPSLAAAHEGHEPLDEDDRVTVHEIEIVDHHQLAQANEEAAPSSGTAPYRFRLFRGITSIPEAHWDRLRLAHSGFAVDTRSGRGEAYFALPQSGILRVSADMDRVEVIESPAELRGVNMHNASFWQAAGEQGRITWASENGNKVFTTSLAGQILSRLEPPDPDFFQDPAVSAYFSGDDGRFVPTDTDLLGRTLYITTGYSPLDRVLTATLSDTTPDTFEWAQLNWGGKGENPAQFNTSHGVTIAPDGQSVWIADRANKRLQRFTPDGQFIGLIDLPEECLACDVSFLEDYMLVPCLRGADEKAGAPILLYRGGRLVSTIMPRSELGLPRFRHTHNAVLRKVDGRLYILALAWNPGDYAVFEQIVE